ncbi:MAG: sigma-E factor regulatory protein RseB domain-containing protein, partial [Terriglobia bacterium]
AQEPLSAAAIVDKFMRANEERDRLLAGYQVERVYSLRNELSEKEAVMQTEVTFGSPAELQVETCSRKGSGFIISRVFGRITKAEQEAVQPEQRARSALTPDNYDFALEGRDRLHGRTAFVLTVSPKREDKYLFKGRIWIDAHDFALMQAEGTVPKRPSFWVRKIKFRRLFRKVGPFWLPHKTEGEAEVLLYGTTWVTITNSDYRVRLHDGTQAVSR